MQRGPPRPRDSSAEGISRTLRPFSLSSAFVTSLRSYTTMVPGAMHSVFEPSFHCSRSAAMRSPPPQGSELHGVADVLLEDVLELAAHLLDLDTVALGGDLEDGQRAHDAGMDGELVDVDLGEHRVKVHHRAVVRDVERPGWSRPGWSRPRRCSSRWRRWRRARCAGKCRWPAPCR